jgi:hypothetical protein
MSLSVTIENAAGERFTRTFDADDTVGQVFDAAIEFFQVYRIFQMFLHYLTNNV